MNFSNPVRTLRLVGLIEAVSYVLLLLIAVPLKYFYGYPAAVRWTGMIHGALFIAFVLSLVYVKQTVKWPLKRSAFVFIASIIPFATFIIDRHLKAYAHEFEATKEQDLIQN